MKVGDVVQWSRGRKPLGRVVHVFYHAMARFGATTQEFAVVESLDGAKLIVVRVSDDLTVCL